MIVKFLSLLNKTKKNMDNIQDLSDNVNELTYYDNKIQQLNEMGKIVVDEKYRSINVCFLVEHNPKPKKQIDGVIDISGTKFQPVETPSGMMLMPLPPEQQGDEEYPTTSNMIEVPEDVFLKFITYMKEELKDRRSVLVETINNTKIK